MEGDRAKTKSRKRKKKMTEREREIRSLHLLLNAAFVTATSTAELPIRRWAQLADNGSSLPLGIVLAKNETRY